ncbi:Pol polyprotein [Elysia marginata]|uniref:Pol polyprotein n=1 Tax=Elysia marginata TaxID=1093978 RepID=A0AAV4J372_9GAST|nr:Pol polyprotein [Elysia marginata]
MHDDMGHPGYDKTLALIRSRFFWPLMTRDIEGWTLNCGGCLRFKRRPQTAPLVGIQTQEPLELVCTDFLKLDMSKGGIQYLLVITDHFTRFAQAVPTRNMSARTTAAALLGFIQTFGVPKRLHSDQGANFESKTIHEFCNLLGIQKSRTTPYHPMGNGACERLNQTLIRMVGTLPDDKKKNWQQHVQGLVFAYNATPHESTGFSPYFLMYGRAPRLIVDGMFPIHAQPKTDYARQTHEALQWAWKTAEESSQKAKQHQKRHYDRTVRGATLTPGDQVLAPPEVPSDIVSEQAEPLSPPKTSPPVPVPRRSARQHNPPEWLSSGEYVTAASHSWKLQVLLSLLHEPGVDKSQITAAILKTLE